jgi:hypothetical protein
MGAALFGELPNIVLANIAQQAVCKVAKETFKHLLTLQDPGISPG